MSDLIKLPEELVFGLDIGTRSIVGTVGYRDRSMFHAVAMCVKEHTSRAMMDGQIHDIAQVGQTILEVKKELEKQLDRKLKQVCIAAAGRVLRTITTKVEYEYGEETVIDQEMIHSLDLLGIEKAHQELHENNDSEIRFYCVGYSVVKYFLNGGFITNLEGHKGVKVGAELIATFLPDEVVEGLYSAVDYAGLEVANLTLEPIAAINVAIPERFRMLNIGLVDVGAGTSDICLTKDGSIIAYGMIPMAGDELTEVIARQYLVDFNVAEKIKTAVKKGLDARKKKKDAPIKKIKFKDIMGLSHEIDPQEVYDSLKDTIDEITKNIADKIVELNGDKPVSAVFVVGGGGKFPGFTEKLAEHLGLLEERVALRGEEVLGQVKFYQKKIKKDSLYVTPIGICMNFYDKTNNFVYVQFNGDRVKLYNNNRLTVVEAAMQAGFPNDGLFPKRGQELNFVINGKNRIVRGGFGEAAIIKVNGLSADINTPIDANDIIEITPSTAGEAATLSVEDLPEFSSTISVIVNENAVVCPKFVQANGELVSGFYGIKENDDIVVLNYYTLQQLLEFMDIILPEKTKIMINNKPGTLEDKIYDNFTVDWFVGGSTYDAVEEAVVDAEEDARYEALYGEENVNPNADVYANLPDEDDEQQPEVSIQEQPVASITQPATVVEPPQSVPVTTQQPVSAETQQPVSAETQQPAASDGGVRNFMVMVNGKPVHLKGKKDYIYVDVFDLIDFDLNTLKGSRVVTKLNGMEVSYIEPLKPNDRLDIYWEE